MKIINQYYVANINLGGGLVNGQSTLKLDYDISKGLDLKDITPIREHFEFLHFVYNNKNVLELPKGIKSNVNVSTSWTPIDYIIQYVDSVSSHSNPSTISALTQDSIIFSNPEEREGYEFKGWYSDKEYTKLITNGSDLELNNQILYAKWNCLHSNFSYADYVPNSIEKEGYTGDKTCTNCGEVLEKGDKIPKCDVVVKPGEKIEKKDNILIITDNKGNKTTVKLSDGGKDVKEDDNKQVNNKWKKPTRVSKLKVKKIKGKKYKISWKKIKGCKYEVKYSTSKKMKKSTRVSKSKNYLSKKLKKGKTYYVKVRAFKVVNNKRIYGSWSKVVKFKVK